MMRDLIAERNRLRDMILEQEADPWLTYSDAEMRAVLTDENMAIMLLEIQQHLSLRTMTFARMSKLEVSALLGEVNAYDVAIGHSKDATRLALGNMRAAEVEIAAAHARYEKAALIVRTRFENAQDQWNRLGDRARAWLQKPHPNPANALDFPDPERSVVGQERAIFYPERTAKQEGQLRKLREALDYVDRDLEERSR